MELYLQFGYGMMDHCKEMLIDWKGGSVILSPRDLKPEQLNKFAVALNKIPGGKCLLDPQFYLPHADHERLRSHDYWPSDYSTGAFFSGPPLNTLLTKLRDLNLQINSPAMLLPGILASVIDDDWLNAQTMILESALSLNFNLPIYSTIALSSDAVRSDEQVEILMERAAGWKADGYYIVCEHPKGDYLVSDTAWLANVLDIVAGLRLQRAKVIIGYCNHQMLIANVAKATAIASGTWMNVRSFPPEKFRTSYDEDIKQRSTWYYCPQSLSEYKITFLDIARRFGKLGQMAPSQEMEGRFTEHLFQGGQPSTIGLTEQFAFRHYLFCLKQQIESLNKNTFDEVLEADQQMLTDAETLLHQLTADNIRGQNRDFAEIIDISRAALSVFARTRGAIMRRAWASL